jgi:hypothetical protein
MADDQLLQQALKRKPQTADTIGAIIWGADDKPVPIDADLLGLSDSAAGGVLKKLTWANAKATLKTYFDTLYDTIGAAGAAIASHLGAYAHGDIAHANRSSLDLVSGTNSGNVTIGTANGLSIAGQVLSLQSATGAVPGALTAGDWTTFSAKEPAIAAGVLAQYWRGNKSWGTLNQSAVAGLTTTDSPTFAGLTVTGDPAFTSAAPTLNFTSTNSSSGVRFNVLGTATQAFRFQYGGTTLVQINIDGQLTCQVLGKGLSVKEGSNAKQGVATLIAGTVTVLNTSVTASSRIFLAAQSLGTIVTPAALAVTGRVAGTSFMITSSAGTDTSVIAYEIFEPS